MQYGKNGKSGDRNDPARRRLSRDEFMARDQQIWSMRADGHKIQHIADTVGCGLATVDRALKRLVARERRLDEELADDVDAVLARYDEQSLHAEDVTRPEQIPQLNDLEWFRLGHLRMDHPARRAAELAAAARYRRPAPPEPTYLVGAGSMDLRDRDADW